MASPSLDIEAQNNRVKPSDPPPPADTANPTTVVPRPQPTSTNQHHNGGSPAQQTPGNSEVQRDENHGDSSDGLWSMYLTEAEKQDTQVTESWKGDTDGILVFTGLFSATVAAFIIESYKTLSPDPSDTTNALLAQISVQLVNISNGTPLASVAVQSGQPFKPTASAVRVNVLWFLSLILSLNCALSATLMQQWARRYQELAQRRGAFHRRGRMRAYIFDGISRFGMTRAVATMPMFLHISVFLFFAGLVEFLFPIYTTVAYATLSCILVFVLAYANLTVLPNIYLNCPYATPLSAFTWRISQFSAFGFLWTILKIEGLSRKSWSQLWAVVNKREPECHGLRRWRETVEKQVKTRRQWFSQGMRKSVELSAYRADSTVVTSALVWTLAALDEDKEIEDFAARIPGFFDSRVVPDAKLAILPLMTHQTNTDPVFGSRLYDLLKTCIPETSVLEEKMRKNRLQVCMKCLWSFAKAYNQLGSSQLLPPYFSNVLASPQITHRIHSEEDPGIRVIGRCFGALIVNKLATDLESRTDPINNGELACLSAILGTESHDLKLLLSQPGAVALANMISLTFDKIGGLANDTVPSGVLDVVQQTLGILCQTISSQENAEAPLSRSFTIINGSNGKFECILVSRLLDLLNSCILSPSPFTEGVRMTCLQMCLMGLWYFGRAYNELENSGPLPSYIYIAFADPEMTRRIPRQHSLAVCLIGRCVGALVVNKLVADINSRGVPITNDELACLSAILGIESDDVTVLLSHPGAIEFTNRVILTSTNSHSILSAKVPSDVPDVLEQTFGILSRALPAELNAMMQLNRTDTLTNASYGTSYLTGEMYTNVVRSCLRGLWNVLRASNDPGNSIPLPSYIPVAFTKPEMTHCIRMRSDPVVHAIGYCVGALIVNKLAADFKTRDVPARNDELAYLSAILGIKCDDVTLLLSSPGAIEFTNIVFLASANINSTASARGVPAVVERTFSILFQALPAESTAVVRPNWTDTLMGASEGTSSLPTRMYRDISRAWMKNLWHFTRERSEPENSLPLPSYICVAFSNPEMTRRLRTHRDPAVRAIGRCIVALVVNKLAADIKTRGVPVSNGELASLSAILGTESRDVRHCFSHPHTIELVNVAPLVLGDVGVVNIPANTRSMLQQTLRILSCALPVPKDADLLLADSGAFTNLPEDRFGRSVIFRLHNLLNMCTPYHSPLIEEVRISCLRMSLKSLWHCVNAYHQTSNSLPSYFPLVLVRPEVIRHFQTEQDPVSRITGCCFWALVVSKLVDVLESPISLSGDVPNAELACISVILGAEYHEVLLSPRQLYVINLRNVVSVMSGEIDTFTTGRIPADMLKITQDTLEILVSRLHVSMFVPAMPTVQWFLLQDIFSDLSALTDQPKNKTVKALLDQILEKLPPGVERLQGIAM
ncbi:hypothetical protein H4582DRAFT_8940 [Lactarius indigo]|nr:hypothetical protein H4582DRAFT_8940 [Lactarius indigo]